MKNYIPKSKDDFKAISYLKKKSLQEIKQDVPALLELMQDLHWEVAHEIATYFIPYVNEIKTDLLKILRSNDNEWKFGIISALMANSLHPLDKELVEELKRIAFHPNNGEKIEGVDEIAYEIVKPK